MTARRKKAASGPCSPIKRWAKTKPGKRPAPTKPSATLTRWARVGSGDRLADWGDVDDAMLRALTSKVLDAIAAAIQFGVALARLRARSLEIRGRR